MNHHPRSAFGAPPRGGDVSGPAKPDPRRLLEDTDSCSTISLHVNGQVHELAVPGPAPLLQVLRNDLGLNGPKYGCGLGECGACLVLIDGVAARSCCIPVAGVGAREVTTPDGLAPGETLHPVQQAYVAAQAAQCGYCLNGMVMAVAGLPRAEPAPSEDRMSAAL